MTTENIVNAGTNTAPGACQHGTPTHNARGHRTPCSPCEDALARARYEATALGMTPAEAGVYVEQAARQADADEDAAEAAAYREEEEAEAYPPSAAALARQEILDANAAAKRNQAEAPDAVVVDREALARAVRAQAVLIARILGKDDVTAAALGAGAWEAVEADLGIAAE